MPNTSGVPPTSATLPQPLSVTQETSGILVTQIGDKASWALQFPISSPASWGWNNAGRTGKPWKEKCGLTCMKGNFSSRSMMMGKITSFKEKRSGRPHKPACRAAPAGPSSRRPQQRLVVLGAAGCLLTAGIWHGTPIPPSPGQHVLQPSCSHASCWACSTARVS